MRWPTSWRTSSRSSPSPRARAPATPPARRWSRSTVHGPPAPSSRALFDERRVGSGEPARAHARPGHARTVSRRPGPRIPLPDPLGARPFGLREAREAGLGRGRLLGRDLERPFHGARWSSGTAATLLARCAAFEARAQPGGFFCSVTAARLLELPLPARLIDDGRDLDVGVALPRRAVRARGVRGRSIRVSSADLARVRGFWVTTPVRTWRDLALDLSVPELVAVGDHIVNWRWPAASRDDMRLAVSHAAGRPGSARLRAAVALLDPAAESPMESQLRAVLVLGGLPPPVANHPVRLPGVRTGYRIDLAYPRERIGLEFQGGYHHDVIQWRADMTRASRLRAHGWEIVELNYRDLDDQVELVDRIGRVLASRAGHSSQTPLQGGRRDR